MKRSILAAAAAALLAVSNAQALEWRLGVAYASGVEDVADLYQDNLEIEGFDADVDVKFPLGLAAGVMYDWPSGIRGDFGVGPAFFIGGDVDYFEAPIFATVGYNFRRTEDISPYVRAGLVYHYASGDYYSSSDPGLQIAIGVDFARFALEVSFDHAEVELDTYRCNVGFTSCRPYKDSFSTYDVVVSGYWKFYTFRDPRRR